jgi:hypothetical protein
MPSWFPAKMLALPDYNSDQTVIIGVQHVVDYRLSLKRASLRHRPITPAMVVLRAPNA